MEGSGSSEFCDTAAVFGCGLSGAAGAAAQKLDANKIAEIESNATERVTWRAEARAELFLRFFMVKMAKKEELPANVLLGKGDKGQEVFLEIMIFSNHFFFLSLFLLPVALPIDIEVAVICPNGHSLR